MEPVPKIRDGISLCSMEQTSVLWWNFTKFHGHRITMLVEQNPSPVNGIIAIFARLWKPLDHYQQATWRNVAPYHDTYWSGCSSNHSCSTVAIMSSADGHVYWLKDYLGGLPSKEEPSGQRFWVPKFQRRSCNLYWRSVVTYTTTFPHQRWNHWRPLCR